jgi:hypothetical protein
VLALQQREQLPARLVLLDDHVADIGAVEAGDELAGLLERQPLADLAARLRIGGGGERDPRHRREALVQHRQAEVLGAEIVAPLRDAVRLVDREQRDPAVRQQLQAALGQQPLGGDVEQVEFAREHRPLDATHVVEPERGVEELGAHAVLAQRHHLVLHQRDQR